MNNSPTPRTDAEVKRDGIPVTVGTRTGPKPDDLDMEERPYVDANFARQLEREVAALREALIQIRDYQAELAPVSGLARATVATCEKALNPQSAQGNGSGG